MSDRAIARALGVSDKTAAKAAGDAQPLGPRGTPQKGFTRLIESLRLPSKDAPVQCGLGCPHSAGGVT